MPGLIDGTIQNITIGTVLAALFECVRDHHHLIDGVLFGLADHVLEHAIVLRPSTLMFDFRYRPRHALGIGEPLRGLHFVGAAEIHDLHQSPRTDFFEHRVGDGARSLDRQLALRQVFAHGGRGVEGDDDARWTGWATRTRGFPFKHRLKPPIGWMHGRAGILGERLAGAGVDQIPLVVHGLLSSHLGGKFPNSQIPKA